MLEKQKTDNLCEENVFARVYREHFKTVFDYIYYKCGDIELSQDLVQEAFIKLWRGCERVDIDKSRAFLFTVARNAFYNKAKRGKVELKYRTEKASSPSSSETPEDILEQKEFEKKLNDAINELSEGQREVFLMNRIDGLKYREIAALLGITQKAVEKRMHGALLHMRKVHDRI